MVNFLCSFATGSCWVVAGLGFRTDWCDTDHVVGESLKLRELQARSRSDASSTQQSQDVCLCLIMASGVLRWAAVLVEAESRSASVGSASESDIVATDDSPDNRNRMSANFSMNYSCTDVRLCQHETLGRECRF